MRSSDILLGTVCIFAAALAWALAGRLHHVQGQIAPSRDMVSKVPLGGFQKFAADIEWMLFLQYLGTHKLNEENSPEIYRRARRIVSLDPDFRRVYYEGSLILASENPDLALKLIDEGIKHPRISRWWKLPMLAGITLMRDQRRAHANGGDMNQAVVERARDYFRLAVACEDGIGALSNLVFCDAYLRYREEGGKPFIFFELDGWLQVWREENRDDSYGTGPFYFEIENDEYRNPLYRPELRILGVLRRIHRDHADHPELDKLTAAVLAEVWPQTRFNMTTLTPLPNGAADSFRGFLQQPGNRSYPLDLSAKYDYLLIEMTLRASHARGYATVTVNGKPVAGLEQVPLGTSRLTVAAAAPPTVSRGDLVELRLEGVEGMAELAYAIEYFR